jgi:putative nucleotidyltransferase with HDIG domain
MYLLIGPLGFILATAVAVEMYYPWKLLGEQRGLFLKSLQLISNAVDVKDPYTAHHSRRVSRYAVSMARLLGVPEPEVERIRIGALMHDIGKIGVPGRVIRKPAKLTDEEMEIMKGHVEAGAKIVGELEILNRSTDIVLHHHENFDGTGYPTGLAGDDIPLGSRIVFVADAFDALTTDRPYRKGRSKVEALQVLEANTPKQFDPRAVEALRRVLEATS